MKITREALMKALNHKRFIWVDKVMKEEVPPDIYGSMRSSNIADHERALLWLREHGYRVEDCGDGVIQIFRGTTLLRRTRFILELEQPEELLDLAEVATHENIPPPPWNPKPQ